MFGSHARPGGGNGNPFGSSAGPAMAANPFQGGKQSYVAPVFGSGGFQPPLPPGGMAGTPAIVVPRKKQQATTFGGASAASNPFAGGGGALNQTAFGGSSGGNNRTSFGGSASKNDRAPGPGRNGGGSRNKSATTFGGVPSVSTTFGQSQTSFGGGVGFHPPVNPANEYSFGGKGGHRNSDGPASHPNTSFGGGFGAGPSGLAATSPGATTFGNRSLRPKKKQITPSGADGSVGENPFAPRSTGGNRQSAPFNGAGSHEESRTTTFGSTGPKSAGATTYGGGFPQSDGFGALEAPMNSGAKTAFGKLKRIQVNNNADGVGKDTMQGKPKTSSRNRPSAAAGNAFGAPTPSPEQSPTAVQMKHKKKPMRSPPPSSSDNDEGPQSFNADPSDGADKKAELAFAVNLDGTCIDMCSPKERELHIRVDELSVFEKCFPGQPGFERELIIKRFQRSSADHKLNIPSEIRPPGVLRQTQLYIEQEIMDRERLGPDPRFSTPRPPEIIELYNFCWDRFRMIRKDFVLQNYRGAGGRVHPIVLDVHERIARYHVLSEHELCEVPSFVAQQNMEQLGQTLKSLNELYDESRKLGDPAYWSPFEAEFRAYFILCTLDNGRGLDVLKFVKGLPRSILESDMVKFAMRVFVSRHTNDYFQFFKLLREATYLQACLLFRYIPGVRSSALQRMNRGFRNQPYPLLDLVELLCFDDEEHAVSVCHQHGLEISPMTDGQTEILAVHFGGEFLSENQLRRDKTPLEIHSSHVYVGQKQGNYLRRDVCRGVTEYDPEEYPALSKLIQDTENQERARLYPDRPPYQDKYSYFASFDDSNPHLVAPSVSQDFPAQDNIHHSNGFDQHRQMSELELIAKRKADLEQKQKLALQRLEQLKREKEERILSERKEKEAADAKARQEAAAKAQAEVDIQAREREKSEALKRQQELENRLCEEKRQQMLQKQREIEAERRQIEEARQAAIRAKEAEQRRIEQQRIEEQAARKREEAMRLKQESERLAAEARERQRQKELAKERARLQRQAELDAKHREQLEKERIQRKIALRIHKQKCAVMKLRFHIWKKYLIASRDTRRPVKIDSTFFGSQIHERPVNVVDWLFDGKRSASSLAGIRRRKLVEPTSTSSNQVLSPTFVADLWRPLDLASLVGPRLLKQNLNMPTVGWKMVIADLVDGNDSGFGHWCAAKAGVEGMSSSPTSLVSQSEYHSVFHYRRDSPPQVAGICCRYVDASIVKDVYATRQQIIGVSAIVFPVGLSELQDQGKRARWQQRIEKLRQALSPECRVALFILALGSDPALAAKGSENMESDVHQYVEHELRLTFTNAVVSLDSSLLVNGVDTTNADVCGSKFEHMVFCLVGHALPFTKQTRRFELKDLLEDAFGMVLRLPVASEFLPKQAQLLFARVRCEIIEKAQWKDEQSAPELQDLLEPISLHSMRTEVDSVLTSLGSVQLIPEASGPFGKLQVCDLFFQHMSGVINLIFQCLPAASDVSALEVKKKLYNSLLSIHEQLQSKTTAVFSSVQDAASVFPWQKILELVYVSFFEALDGVAVLMPSDWDPATLVPNAKPVKATSTTSRSIAIVPEPVPVSASSIKRSFGVAIASEAPEAEEPAAMASYLMVPKDRAIDRAVKKLRQQIAHDKQVSSSYQRMLQRELARWSISPP